MRIAIWHNLYSGGGKRALYYHVKGLKERGHYIKSFCPDTVDQDFLPLSDLIEEAVFPLKEKLNKKRLIHSKDFIYENTKALIEHCKECALEINQGGFDVLFANSSSLYYISHIGRFVNIPKLIYLGEPYRIAYEALPDFIWKAPARSGCTWLGYLTKRLKHQYKLYWYSFLCREEYISASAFDLILVNSIYSKETVDKCYNLPAEVCYLGIDTTHFNNAGAIKQNYVLGLGYVHITKGIKRAIDTVSTLPEKARPRLIWVGNNKRHTSYIDEIKKYAIYKKVDLTIKSYITDNELIILLKNAQALLYLPHLEPFGLAPLEANACGTAVVGIQEGGVKETIKDGINGFTSIHFSTTEIAENIRKLSDLTFSKEIGSVARKYVIENWGYDQGIDNIESYIMRLGKKAKR